MSNRKNYDAAFCGNLPLAYVNTIQPNGYLLVVKKDSLQVLQVSGNCKDLFAISIDELLSGSLADLVSTDLSILTDQKFSNSSLKIPFSISISGSDGFQIELLALVHAREECLIVELFKTNFKEHGFIPFFQKIKYAYAEIEPFDTIQSFGNAAVQKIKELSGFDSVLMYQFDEDWNGKVIAECNSAGKRVYLGQQFPASDIPKQARALYQKNTYRLISDVAYTPVKIYPILNPLSLSFVDLSEAHLRGVAPVHIQYLKNMNVKASMSIRILINNQLWGLFALHHPDPHYLDYETCCSLELLSEFISRHLIGMLNKEQFQFRHLLSEQYNVLQQRVYHDTDLGKALFGETHPNILTLFDAKGAFMSLGRRNYAVGQIPEELDIENLIFWLHEQQSEDIYASDNLGSEFQEADKFGKVASGLLAIELDRTKDNYLLIFRPETEQTIDWGGNPNEAIVFSGDGETYNPRHSFSVWKERISGMSKPWQKEELIYAKNLRSFILEYLNKQI